MNKKTALWIGLALVGVVVYRHLKAQSSFQQNFINPLQNELNNPGTIGDNLGVSLGGIPGGSTGSFNTNIGP